MLNDSYFAAIKAAAILPDGTMLFQSAAALVEIFDIHVDPVGNFRAKCRVWSRFVERCEAAAGDPGGRRVGGMLTAEDEEDTENTE